MKKTLRPSGGHILDIDSLEISDNYLSLAQNVHTRKGFPSRINGRRVAYPDVTTEKLHLLNLSLNTFNWWMAFGPDNIEAAESSNLHDISYPGQLTVANTYEWVSTLLNGIPVFTNGKNPLLFWNGEGTTAADEVPDWPAGTVCKAVVAFKFHLFALNIDGPSGVFENMLLWSDAAEPGALPQSWTPAPSNEAGSAIIADTPGRCIIGRPLGSQLMIYKPTSVFAVEYIGQQPDNIFAVRPINRSLGTLSPHTVLDMGTRHLVVGNDDIVLTDGVNEQSIADGRIKQYLSNSIDEVNAQNSFAIRDLNRREVWVCVPESGSQFATVAHIWDEKRNTWTTRDLSNVRYGTTGFVLDTTPSDVWDNAVGVWDDDIQLWNASSDGAIPRVITAEVDNLYLEDTTDATIVTARITKTDIDFGDATLFKMTRRVWIEGSGAGLPEVRFRLGKRDSTDENEPIEWGPFVDRQPNGAPYEINGVFIAIEIESNGSILWTITRIIIEAVANGT